MSEAAQRRRRTAFAMAALLLGLGLCSLMVGSQGWEVTADWRDDPILWSIRLPRTLGVIALGLLLGTSGALAQGLFRNPLADPYLLGSGAGAALAVTLWAAAVGGAVGSGTAAPFQQVGAMGMAFGGALAGVAMTLLLARGAQHTPRLLLAGLVVGIMLGSLTDLVASLAPEAWRQRQSLLLGQTNLLGPDAVWALGLTAALAVPAGMGLSRVLDALTLGDDAARSLGLPLSPLRLALVGLVAWCTAVAVSQAGLILFVALAAPHIVRHLAPSGHRFLVGGSALAGSVLLLAADVLARLLHWPQELPVGVVTGIGGGLYLLLLLHRRGAPWTR